jgi:hypothetical protein
VTIFVFKDVSCVAGKCAHVVSFIFVKEFDDYFFLGIVGCKKNKQLRRETCTLT